MESAFTTVVEQAAGMKATGIPVPDEAVAGLGGARNPAVVVTIRRPGGDYTFSSTVGRRDGRSMLPLSAAHRAAAGLSAGDGIEVVLRLDEAPRSVTVPDDLHAALERAGLLEAFGALSYSRQRAFVDPIVEAKADLTRVRRIEKVLTSLSPG